MADAGRKQLEQLLHQLQEQLQINLLQQTHLMQNSGSSEKPGGNKTSQAMQQLQIQQQQLISQLQLVQQRLLMVWQINKIRVAQWSNSGLKIGPQMDHEMILNGP